MAPDFDKTLKAVHFIIEKIDICHRKTFLRHGGKSCTTIFQNVNHDKGWTHMSVRVYSCPGEHDRTTVFYTVSVR